MKPDESLNPYAAPKAQLVNLDKNGTVAPRRPASVKWATFLMGFSTMIIGMLYWQAIEAQGVANIWKQQPLFDPAILPLIGLMLGLFGGRHKIAYYGVAAILAIIVIRFGIYFFGRLSFAGSFTNEALLERFIEGLMFYAIVCLFYRFTFGLPSRRYFGVAREEERAERPV